MNDRYGLVPLFYFVGPGEICVSPSLVRLLQEGAPTELDERALSVFVRLGFFIKEDTPFKAIRALPPNALLRWQGGRLELSGGFAVPIPLRIRRREAIDRYADLFQRTINRFAAHRQTAVVPLSGGRDSRHILLALCAAGRRPDLCITVRHFPPRPNEDADIAPRVAEALGVPYVLLTQPLSRFKTEVAKNVRTHFCSDEHTDFLVLADYLAYRPVTVYDGIGGDIISAGLFLDERSLALFRTGRTDELADALLEEHYLPKLLPPDQYARLHRRLAIEHLAAELRRHVDAPNPVGSFFFWNRTRREIALVPYALLSTVEVVAPYLDEEVYEFLASLPAELLVDHQFHTDTIARAYPPYQGLAYESKLAPGVLDRGGFCRFALELAIYALRRRGSRFVRRSFLLPRLLRCLVDLRYAASIARFGVQAVYLLQLESLAAGNAGSC